MYTARPSLSIMPGQTWRDTGHTSKGYARCQGPIIYPPRPAPDDRVRVTSQLSACVKSEMGRFTHKNYRECVIMSVLSATQH